MQQLENAESKSPGKYDYWYANIIGVMEDLMKKNETGYKLSEKDEREIQEIVEWCFSVD
jgi:hypothetical protein